MKLPFITAVGLIVWLCGCSTMPRGGSMGGTVAPPSSAPSFGSPSAPSLGAPSFGAPITPSARPQLNGPTLGAPEAYDDVPKRATPRANAPTPKSRSANYQPTASIDANTGEPKLFSEPVWTRSYRSTDRRPIETLTLGKGLVKIAVLGSLHGDEPQSVALVEELARELQGHPEMLSQCTVLLIKSANPDGLVRRSPYNLNGVDLNRNFPSANWQAQANNRAGSRTAPEIETRTIIRLFEDFQPELLVHVKDSRGPATVNYEGPESLRADQVAQRNGSKVAHGLGLATTGSVENYADTRLQCPSLTLLLPRESTMQAAWAKHRAALVAAVAPTTGARLPPKTKSLSNADPFEGRPTVRPVSTQSSKPQPAFPMPVPEHGYFELPAP